jgi:NADH-quinone oxidoreductase subunit C
MRTVAHEDVALATWPAAVAAAKDEGWDTFDWLSAVDRMYAEPAGYDIVVHLIKVSGDVGPGHAEGRLLRTRVPDGEPVPSLTGVFAGAAWYERETFEMFGISFDGYHDRIGRPIRPLLLPEGFEGNPLKKSFVLTARVSKPWPGAKEPGEGHGGAGTGRKKAQAMGMPDEQWGPRDPRAVEVAPEAAPTPDSDTPAEGPA